MPEAIDQRKNLPMQTRLLPVSSFDEAAGTVELVWSTGSTVRRFDYWEGEYYEEALSMAPEAVNLTRLNSGAPLLNAHNQYDLSSVIGVVERAWLENGVGKAVVRFSERAEVAPILADVKAGIIRNVSVGYRVNTFQIEKREGQISVYTAVDWEPFELSLVPVPADAGAGTRSEVAQKQGYPCEFVTRQSASIDLKTTQTEEVNAMTEDEIKRGQELAAKTAREEAVKEERARSTEIRAIVRKLKLDDALAEKMITDGVDLETARSRAIDAAAEHQERTQPRTFAQFQTVTDETETRRSAVQEALLHRFNPTQYKLTDAGRQFRGMSLIDMARDCLESSGVRVRGMAQAEIAQLALRSGGMHSTGDFPLILGNTVNRTLRDGYALVPRTFTEFCRQATASDFKTITRVALSDISKMQKIKEGGEYKNGTMGDSAESYKLQKWGEKIAITWETLINDDLGAFTRLPAALGAEAAQIESDVVWDIILTNAVMSDGKALFHADHKNLVATGEAINIASLSAARATMRKQVGPRGRVLNIAPAYLLVGPDKELEANQYTSANYVAQEAVELNPAFNTSLKPIVEPRLLGNQWYLAAAPGLIDTIEYAYLEGEQGIVTETRNGFDVDGIEVKARLVFAAAAIDHRGLFKNPGA